MAELPQMKPFGAEIQQRLTALETATGVSGGGEAGDIVLVTEESLDQKLADYSTTEEADQKYLGKGAKAESAKTADSVPMSGVEGLDTELQGLVKKSGAWYAYEGEKIGQGRENAKTYLETHPELMDELERKVRAHYHLDGSAEDGEADDKGAEGKAPAGKEAAGKSGAKSDLALNAGKEG